MGLASRAIEFSIRKCIKPYLEAVSFDSQGLSQLRRVAEASLSYLQPSLASVDIQTTRFPHFDVEVITPKKEEIHGKMLYCPGGGFICCSPRTHRNLTVRLATHCRLQLHVINYTKVPEGSLLSTIEDTTSLYRTLLQSRLAGSKILCGGDSAGGHLALSTLLCAHKRGLEMPDGLVCLSPWTDLSCPDEGRFHREWDPLLPMSALRRVAKLCLKSASPYDERYSPLYGDLSCLPPTLVQAVSTELLYHDATRFVARAKEAGVDAHLSSWVGVPHCFQLLAPYMSKAVAALDEINYFINRIVHH